MNSVANSAGWTLDPVLERDTRPVGDLPLSRILFSRDANYPWLLLVPRRAAVSEIIDLDEADQMTLTVEIARAYAAKEHKNDKQQQKWGHLEDIVHDADTVLGKIIVKYIKTTTKNNMDKNLGFLGLLFY